MANLTPMMQQYVDIKKNHQTDILFYRLGDFYEMFFEDAITASKVLEITLTARNKKGKGEPIPMCGIPYHSAENYIAKLTKAGHNVAICEQVSSPNSKGIVQREVIRVITPGTTLNHNTLDANRNNYLLVLKQQQKNFQLSYCDLTTGDFHSTTLNLSQEIISEITRIAPAEIILDLTNEKLINQIIALHPETKINSIKTDESSEKTLLKYLEKTQKTKITHLKDNQHYSQQNYLILDHNCFRNLEIFHNYNGKNEATLVKHIDQTQTSMGARLLRKFLIHPLFNKQQIDARLDTVTTFFNNQNLLEQTRQSLKSFYDLERILSRLTLGHGNARDLIQLNQSLHLVPEIKNLLKDHLPTHSAQITPITELTTLISQAILPEPPITTNQGGMVKYNFDSELDQLLDISKNGKQFLNELQQTESKKTGISSLKIKFNKVFGYYIEVSKANSHLVPAEYIRKQTLVNAERYITPELKTFEEKVLSAEEKIKILEFEIFQKIRAKVLSYTKQIQSIAEQIARIDVLATFAFISKKHNYSRPNITTEFDLKITEGRHPVIETLVGKTNFISNDCTISSASSFKLITGPNMGGKSTFLRQNALIVLMAHVGCYVPATSATIPLTDKIFTRVGASDNLSKGQSTFMVEMLEASQILKTATNNSLIILDELGRGTSTYDGLSIAWAVTDHIHDHIQAKTLFASHYHELIHHVNSLKHAENLSVAVAENSQKEIIFLYKIINKAIHKSYGIQVAKLAGMPGSVIQKAQSILSELENKNGLQMSLFSAELPREHREISPQKKAILQSIANLQPNSMTPISALNTLIEYQNKLSKS